ncbi:MAG TPA: ABC transporter ATP-binding protein [Ktedonobacterales bacterium]
MSAPTQAAETNTPNPTKQRTAAATNTTFDAGIRSWVRFCAHYLRPWRGRFVLLAVLLFANIGLTLTGPQLVSLFINDATANGPQASGPQGQLLLIAVLALLAALASQAVTIAATYVGQDLGWATTNWLREDLALHLLRLDMSYHNTHTPGEFIERIDGDLTNLSNFFSLLILKVLGSAGLLVGTLVLLWLADWRGGLALALFVALAFAVIIRMRSVAVGAGIEEREVSATFLGFLEERLTGVEDIRVNGGGEYTMHRFTLAMRKWFAQSVHAWTRRSSIWTVTTLLFSLGMALTLGVSAYLYLVLHAISLGTVYLFFQYMVLMQAPIEQITQQLQEFQKAASSLIRVRRLLALRSQIADDTRAAGNGGRDTAGVHRTPLRTQGHDTDRGSAGVHRTPLRMQGHEKVGSTAGKTSLAPTVTDFGSRHASLDALRGPAQAGLVAQPVGALCERPSVANANAVAVRFEHVTFAYQQGGEPVLRDVDFTLPQQAVLGLLGRTGSGKTTISRLLSRLYDASEGAVRLDGVDVRGMPLAELRRRVGVVTQDVQLFQATVRENLTFFDARIPDERIHDVIAQMGLESWFARLPNGLDTPLEGGGGGLSAGEAQLVAFIRVFLRDPGLVILDEPSSRLDLATERLIERGVGALLRNRTAIIIAHRLATVQRADLILTLGDGRVLEFGPREALARDPQSHFAQMLCTGLETALV